MINNAFFELTDDLKGDYVAAFASGSDKAVFKFLRKLLGFIESDSSSFNVLILLENPLKNEEKLHFMQNLHRTCRTFLEEKKRSRDRGTSGAAMCYLGVGHEYGLFGLGQDSEEAFECYLVASRLRHGLGTYKLGQCFEQGKWVEEDARNALHLYKCAAKLGLVEAQHVYGSILMYGSLGAEVDEKMGLHYVSRAALAATSVYPYPLFDMGKWYERKRTTLDSITDEKYSFELYKRGAGLNDPNCQYRIAKCYENGELQKGKSVESAVVWYKRAARYGQVDAQMMLFGFYSSGVAGALDKDFGSSYFWAMRAGMKGNARAVFFLGEYARSGTGVQQDILLGLWWYMISASMGSYEAKIKVRETKAEIERRDIGPDIAYRCC